MPGCRYVERDVHRAEQDRIAQAAGELHPGAVGHWRVSHTIPIEDDEHGDLVVTRLIGSARFQLQGNRFLGRHQGERGAEPGVLYRDGVPGWHRPGNGRRLNRRQRAGARCSDPPRLCHPGMADVRAYPVAGRMQQHRPIAAVVAGGATGAATGSPAVGFSVGVATDAGGELCCPLYGRAARARNRMRSLKLPGNCRSAPTPRGKSSTPSRSAMNTGSCRSSAPSTSPLASCREIAFSVDEGNGNKLKRAWFTSDICKQGKRWKWAAAEPAVERWGFLQ